jgi:hypothetical protein
MYSAFVTVNPCPLNASIVFKAAGQEYTILEDGQPGEDRPDRLQRWNSISSNPVICAQYFQCFMQAFQVVCLGWEPGAKVQTNPNCMFGEVKGYFFKYENTGKGDLHAHGNIIAPALQPHNLLAWAHDKPEQLSALIDAVMCR